MRALTELRFEASMFAFAGVIAFCEVSKMALEALETAARKMVRREQKRVLNEEILRQQIERDYDMTAFHAWIAKEAERP